MKRILKLILLLLFFACISPANLLAQDEGSDTLTIQAPDELNDEDYEGNGTGTVSSDRKYERLYMDEAKLEALRRKKEFQYPDRDSLAARDTVYMQPNTSVTTENRFKGFDANILIWLIIAVAVIVIILQLSGVNMRQLFAPGRLANTATDELASENIHDIPYESAIQKAIQAGNFSLATRLMYLQSLKLLSDRNLIAWHENKTNWQYVYELKNEKLRNSFRTITHIFEYVQYGHMPISEEKFAVVKESFTNFKMHVI